MIRSGIAPVDARLGGITPGRIHLITGGVGTGKTTACLHFMAAGLEADESVAILTLDRASELRSHAAYLGIDIDAPLRAGRLTAVRYRPEFGRRYAYLPSVEGVVEDLRRLLGGAMPPARIVIDPVSPFLADGSPVGAGIAAVVELLDGLGATALLTYPGPVTDGADRRLDPLVERAASIVSLARDADGGFELSVPRARLAGAPRTPIRFTIARAIGLVEAPRLNGDAAVDPAVHAFLERLAASAARSPGVASATESAEVRLTEAMPAGVGRPTIRDAFARALAAQVALGHPTRYTVVLITPRAEPDGDHGMDGALEDLTRIVLDSIRATDGDFAASIDGSVAVYLHEVNRHDASLFAERVLSEWAVRNRGSLSSEFFAHPSEGASLRIPFESSRSS
jgi:KaiC/GvpD/RAD55 family RecA-like ATPase